MSQPATPTTRQCNHAAKLRLPMDDVQSFEDARRGFVADIPALAITRASGAPVWSLAAYGFLAEEQAPESVHPACGGMRG